MIFFARTNHTGNSDGLISSIPSNCANLMKSSSSKRQIGTFKIFIIKNDQNTVFSDNSNNNSIIPFISHFWKFIFGFQLKISKKKQKKTIKPATNFLDKIDFSKQLRIMMNHQVFLDNLDQKVVEKAMDLENPKFLQ